MSDWLVIDADGHVVEPTAGLKKHMGPDFQNRAIAEGEAWDRSLGGTLGKQNHDPEIQLTDMDAAGIDIQVVFPTSQLSLSRIKETALAVERARAYNDWLAEFCATDPRRLKGVAVVALQDVDASVREARRAVEELGFRAIMLPTNVRDEDIGRREYWPLYEEAERLGVGLAVHGGIHMAERMHGRFDTFISVHTVAFPFECMAAVTGLMFAGVPEVFPSLRFAVLEGCCGWVPFLMDRMDEEFELRGHREAPLLKAKPSEYLANGRFYIGVEPEESTVPYVAQRIGVDKLLFASDYPHWDSSWPHVVPEFIGRADLSEADKRQILTENPQRFYGFTADVPARAG
jgi:predicted TIM-barrel fold metal-dependent hydrolase